MSYTLLIKKQAKKALQSVPQPDRTRIAEKIVLLGKDPDDPILDIKKLCASVCAPAAAPAGPRSAD